MVELSSLDFIVLNYKESLTHYTGVLQMRKLTAAKKQDVLNKGIEVRVTARAPRMNAQNNVVAFTHLGFSVATNKLVAVFVKRGTQRVPAPPAFCVVHA